MREIKFRAWDKQAKQMCSVICLNCLRNDEHIVRDSKGQIYNQAARNLILMQYTGLKDKDGVDIYDGDITLTNPKGYEYRYVIRWNNDHGCWSAYRGDVPWGQLDGAEAEDSEVIGNIHQNPNLI